VVDPLPRTRYSPSGFVSPARFFPLLAVALLCASLLSVVMYMLLAGGWYWALVTPTLAGGFKKS
jgi:hypothetical protein